MPKRETIRAVHPYAWLWEPLEEEPTFVLRAMFGAKAVYLNGKLVLCFVDGDEPWHGVLVCTAREQHESLVQEFPSLRPHAVLPKWLYLSDADPAFESTAQRLVECVRQRDLRIGVEPGRRRRSRKAQRGGPAKKRKHR